MYPSIKLATIRKAVRYFARKLTKDTKKTINLCLELIHLGMISILISFGCEYYEYHGGEREEQGLAIGGYESAFLADLVASYLFEKSKLNFRPKIYHVIYQDDGLVVFKGKKKASDIKDCMEEFHQMVNKAEVNQHLQFTAEIWTNEANSPTPEKEDRVQTVTNDELPFLDMKMSWSPEGDLQFGVFREKGQQLKYIGQESTHTPGTLRAIPSGVLNHLTKLTSKNPSIHTEAVDKIYPAHVNALRKAGLAPPVFPTMGDLWRNQDEKVENKKERDVIKKKNRNVYFCVAYSRYFSTSIHRLIDRLKNSFNLTWLRVRISYHIFNSLAELLNGYLAAKIGWGVFSKDLMDRKCSCSLPSKVNEKCAYEGKFRSRCIIYEVTCSMCDAIYIGNTQQTFKKGMDGHLSNLQRLLKNGQK